MKTLILFFVGAALAAGIAHSASAGLVITEKDTVTGGPQPGSNERTTMIQGNKRKLIIGDTQVVTDLDKKTVTMISGQRKIYAEMPMPSGDAAGRMFGGPQFQASEFKKTGKSRTVAGYKCDDYESVGKFRMGEFVMTVCISKDAPGAAEFTKFTGSLQAQLKQKDNSVPKMPDGVPLVQEMTTKITEDALKNLPPEAASAIRQKMAAQGPIVNKSEVLKIAAENLPDTTFTPPPGYTKQVVPAAPTSLPPMPPPQVKPSLPSPAATPVK